MLLYVTIFLYKPELSYCSRMERTGELTVDFGLRLRRLLNEKNLSMRTLATRAGLEPSHVQKIASGQVGVTLPTVQKIAVGLGISVAELFSEFK